MCATVGINLDLTTFITENTPKWFVQLYQSVGHSLNQRTMADGFRTIDRAHFGLVNRENVCQFSAAVMPSLPKVLKVQFASGIVSRKSKSSLEY